MNYKQKYKEALKWMREMYPCFTDSLREDAEHYFPELLESEDEKIRKAIVLGIKRCADAGSIFGTVINNEGVNYHDVLAWLEKQKEQKPAEKQDYSGLTDPERAILRGFLAAGVENVPVTIIKETAQDCLSQMKPTGWSEADESMRWNVISIVGQSKSVQAEEMMDWLKSLRPDSYKNCNSRWKPSEEQMDSLRDTIVQTKGYSYSTFLPELYEDLKKL